MLFRHTPSDNSSRCLVVAVMLLLAFAVSLRANVYATNIKLDGSTNNAAILSTNGVQISYLLNEPATAGLSLRVLSNGVTLWSTNLPGGTNCPLAGTNSVFWNGALTSGHAATAGVYQISITAMAQGYPDWTNIVDLSTNLPMTDPSGIDVNKNTNSPFYGRIFVGNAPPENGNPGIFKFNADSSPADEGNFSTGGYLWDSSDPGEYFYSPWKIAIAGDDKVYINDFTQYGMVLAFDEIISTNFLTVLDADNYPEPYPYLGGLWVQGAGANTKIWMADSSTNSAGILQWTVSTNGALASNDNGVVAVALSANGLSYGPWDVSVDNNGNIYTIQLLDGVMNTNYANTARLFCYTNYIGQTLTNPAWSIGSVNHSLENAYGVAVNPVGTLVAVAVRGYGADLQASVNGGVNVYKASNGQLMASLGEGTNNPEYFNVAWDNVGNLYATMYSSDFAANSWTVFSPPGTNQATTVAVPVIQVYDAFLQPSLSNPACAGGQCSFTLQGQNNVAYLIQYSPDLANWTTLLTNYSTTAIRAITMPSQGDTSFYRAIIP